MYRSPYEAYPFLADDDEDLRCDFEIATDRLASLTGLLRAKCPEEALREELRQVEELIYHLNPTLRTFFSVHEEETAFLLERLDFYRETTKDLINRFVLPCGSERASVAHMLRSDGKALVRLLYRYIQRGGTVDHQTMDFCNILSGYFFFLALYLNQLDGVEELPYESRNYHGLV